LDTDSVGSVDSDLKVNAASKFENWKSLNVFSTVNLVHKKLIIETLGLYPDPIESGYKTIDKKSSIRLINGVRSPKFI
jgi:hypothetical protein